MPDESNKDFELNSKNNAVNRSWVMKRYRSLSKDAKRRLDDQINIQFWLENNLPIGFKIEEGNPDYKRLSESWLQILERSIKIAEMHNRNWDEWAKTGTDTGTIAAKGSESIFSKEETARKSLTPSYRYTSKELAGIFGQSGYIDGKEFKDIIEKRLDTPGNAFNKMDFASNIVARLSDDILDGLLEDPYGFEGCVRFALILIMSPNEKLQNEAFQILRKVPSIFQSNLSKEGILRQGLTGKQLFERVQNEFTISKSDAALNFAKELVKNENYLVNAKGDLDGLKAVIQIYGVLKTYSYDGMKKIEAEKLAQKISEALVPRSTERKYSVYGIFERYGHEKELYNYVQNNLHPQWKHGKDSALPGVPWIDYLNNVENKEFALTFLSSASNKDLLLMAKNPEGRKALSMLYHAMTYSSQSEALEQANRVMATFLQYQDAKQFVGKIVNNEKIPLVPTSDAMFNGISPFAYLKKDGNILLNIGYLRSETEKYKKEISTLPASARTSDGAIFGPGQLIGIVDYDQGGIVIYRPAIYLLQINKKSIDSVSDKLSKSVYMGISVGTLAVGYAPSILEKTVEIASIAFNAIDIAVKQYQGWIISNYKDKGKEFINLVNAVTFCADIAMMGQIVVSPLLTKLTSSWDELKNINPTLTSSKEFKAINSEVDKLCESLRKIDDVPDTDIHVTVRRDVSQQRTPLQRTNRGLDEGSGVSGRGDVPNTVATVHHFTDKNLSLSMKRNLIEDDKLATNFVHEVGANDLHKEFMLNTPETGRSIPYDHDSDKNFEFLYGLAEAAKKGDDESIQIAAGMHSNKHLDGHHALYTDTENCTEKVYDQWSIVVRLPVIRDKWINKRISENETVTEFIRRYHEAGFSPGFRDGKKGYFTTPDARIKTMQEWEKGHKYTENFVYQHLKVNPDTTMKDFIKFLEEKAEKVGRPEIDNIRRELGLLGDTVPISPTRGPPSSSDRYVSAKPRLVDDTEPDIGDTLLGAENHLRYKDSSKEPGYTTTEPASGSRLQAELHYSRINIRTLGDECTDIAQQLGMTEQDLNDYLFIFEKASRLDGGWEEGALQKVVQAEIRKTYETLGPQLGKEMISFGHNPHSISNAIDQMIDSGYGNKGILEEFKVQKKLAESLEAMLGGSRQDARIAIKATNGDVTKAIESHKWKQLIDSWNNEHSLSMRQMSTSEKQQMDKEAMEFAKNEEKIAKSEVKNEVAYKSKNKNREQDVSKESKESKNGFKDRVGR